MPQGGWSKAEGIDESREVQEDMEMPVFYDLEIRGEMSRFAPPLVN